MRNENKFLVEMTVTEQIEAHEKNLKAQKEMLLQCGEWSEAIRRWIAESEATLIQLRNQ